MVHRGVGMSNDHFVSNNKMASQLGRLQWARKNLAYFAL